LNGVHELLAYADDVNLLGDNIDTRKKNTETLIDASKDVGLAMNVEIAKYLLLSHQQHAEKNRYIYIMNWLFGNVKKFGYSFSGNAATHSYPSVHC
jgi:hypothetical protein